MTLTPKQKKVLEFITFFTEENGYSPSQSEIAKHFGFKSLGTVQNYLVRLERNGLLQKTMNAQRSMKVVSQPHTHDDVETENQNNGSIPLPLVGKVAAGYPIEAIESQETLDVPCDMVRRAGEHFVLRVSGDSMIEDGILDGDYVVIRKQGTANNGQTVVALIGNEATIKKFYRRANQVELQPANSKYEPIVVDSMVEHKGFHIEGVLVGLIRRLD